MKFSFAKAQVHARLNENLQQGMCKGVLELLLLTPLHSSLSSPLDLSIERPEESAVNLIHCSSAQHNEEGESEIRRSKLLKHDGMKYLIIDKEKGRKRKEAKRVSRGHACKEQRSIRGGGKNHSL